MTGNNLWAKTGYSENLLEIDKIFYFDGSVCLDIFARDEEVTDFIQDEFFDWTKSL